MKDLFATKTFWINTITIGIAVFGLITKSFPIDPNLAVVIIGVLNIFLRMLTNQPIESVGGIKIR